MRDTCRETRDVQELPALDMGGDVFQPLQGTEGEGGEIPVGEVSGMNPLKFRVNRCQGRYHNIIAVVG